MSIYDSNKECVAVKWQITSGAQIVSKAGKGIWWESHGGVQGTYM